MKRDSDWDIDLEDPTPTKNDAGDYGERALLSAVIQQAWSDALGGDSRALHWFSQPDFSLYATFLGLPVNVFRRRISSGGISIRKVPKYGRRGR